MNYKIAVVRGDGIGPEVVAETIKVLDKIGEKFGHTEHQCNSYHRRKPTDMEISEIIVKTYQKALHKVNIFCRDNKPKRIRAEYKDCDRYQRAQEHGLWIIHRRIPYLTHMYTR